MALLQDWTDEQTGASITNMYFRIGSMQWNTRQTLVISVFGYFSQASRNAGKAPILTIPYSFDVSVFDVSLPSGLRSAIYSYLKNQDEFSEASDV